jgi:two-component system KDP operon response regulator KdpE
VTIELVKSITTSQVKILIIERNPQVQRALRFTLERNDYQVTMTEQYEEGLDLVASVAPEIILLGIGSKDSIGFEFCRELRNWTNTPIIVLSEVDLEEYKIKALDLGADDYLTKPFGMGELLARMRAIVRRCRRNERSQERKIFDYENLFIDFHKRAVKVDGKFVRLTPKEYELLEYMSRNVNRVLTHRMLLAQVWGPDYINDTHTLFVHMANLRSKIEANTENVKLIHTERKIGYRFVGVKTG